MFIIGKYVKLRLKNRESPYYFLSSRDQGIKNISKIEQKKSFLLTFCFIFYNVSHSKTDLHNKYMI